MEKMVPPSASAFLVPVLLTFTLVHTLYYFVLGQTFFCPLFLTLVRLVLT